MRSELDKVGLADRVNLAAVAAEATAAPLDGKQLLRESNHLIPHFIIFPEVVKHGNPSHGRYRHKDMIVVRVGRDRVRARASGNILKPLVSHRVNDIKNGPAAEFSTI